MIKGSSNPIQPSANSVPVMPKNPNQNQNISFGLSSGTRSILKNPERQRVNLGQDSVNRGKVEIDLSPTSGIVSSRTNQISGRSSNRNEISESPTPAVMQSQDMFRP